MILFRGITRGKKEKKWGWKEDENRGLIKIISLWGHYIILSFTIN
jgi:hypothetical protein